MEFLFHRVYEMADLVSSRVDVSFAFEELDWDCPDVSRCLHTFSKASVLGHFCFTHIRLHDLRTARKDPERFDIDDLEAALERYAIPFVAFREFMRQDHAAELDDAYIELNHLHAWM